MLGIAEGCIPVSRSGGDSQGASTMSRLACGMELLFFGSPLDELPQNGNETWQWEIATSPRALQKPPVLHKKGLERFRALALDREDVLVCSYPRCGLSWAHALVFHLCRSDEDGALGFDAARVVGGRGPVLPDAPPTRWNLGDCERQEAPRIFSSHAAVPDLPDAFKRGGARLVVIDRDPRDALVSSFFRLKRLGAKFRALECHDGRLGQAATSCEALTLERVFDDFNDDGRGSASLTHDFEPIGARYSEERTSLDAASQLASAFSLSVEKVEVRETPRVAAPGEYGDYYSWHRDHARHAEDLGEDRVLHIHYERLQESPEAVARDVYAFLFPTESAPSDAKIDLAVHFASFAQTAARGDDALRKGVSGDHRIYLSKEHWDALAVKGAKRLCEEDKCAYQAARLVADCPRAIKAVPMNRRPAIAEAQKQAAMVVGRDWAGTSISLPDGEGGARGDKAAKARNWGGGRVMKSLGSLRRSMTPK